MLVAGNRAKVAQPILEEIVREMETRGLEEWEEMQIIAYPLELLMRCLGTTDESKSQELYTRLCKLDPLRALNLNA